MRPLWGGQNGLKVEEPLVVLLRVKISTSWEVGALGNGRHNTQPGNLMAVTAAIHTGLLEAKRRTHGTCLTVTLPSHGTLHLLALMVD